jgi:hypothetical protein
MSGKWSGLPKPQMRKYDFLHNERESRYLRVNREATEGMGNMIFT